MTDVVSASAWTRRSPLAGAHALNSVLPTGGNASVSLVERDAGGIVQVTALRGASRSIAEALGAATGVEAPITPALVSGSNARLLWSGPGQWLVLAANTETVTKSLSEVLGARAAVSDQSGSKALVRLSGPKARAALAKVIALDLHPIVAPVGFAAMTEVAHVPVHFWRATDEGGHAAFDVLVPRSFAGSVWHALVAAAAAYGLDARTLSCVEA